MTTDVESAYAGQVMATDLHTHIILQKAGWVPPTTTAQASMRILKSKTGKSFIGRYKNSKATAVTKELYYMLYPFRPSVPLEVPLHLNIKYVLPYRKSESKKNLKYDYMPHTSRPDSDNLCKLLLDVMNGVFYTDDSFISKLTFFKLRGKNQHIDIKLSEILMCKPE